ncbi:hypothetical protein D9619_010036 [Psilocybe cf. subviscida]|uniref:FAD/NAD(P)-binding domain-containing protein n=1 Tax=Psilocybe cf. subviscida TaxID=2480587 RepID=A0A8H5F6K9_9AGAR|nr:hypothetical protein D9619_010036 [Psilocybe cf. subviscida]
MSNSTRKNVVVVGGGTGGATLIRILSKFLDASKYNLVLVDARESLILTPATIRLPVANPDGLEDRVFVPLKDIFINGNGTFRQGTVTAIDPSAGDSAVVLDDGDRVPYDVLALSPGATWYGSFDFSGDIKARWAEDRENLKNAQNVVIVGAGAVGIELSGEIKSEYPHKSVTVVQGSSSVLNDAYPAKYRKALQDAMTAKKITFVPNEYIDDLRVQSDGQVKTRSGKGIKADLVIPAYGPKPNTGFIAESLGPDVLSPNKYVKVQPTLQLVNHPNIFVIGDAVDNTEQKQAAKTVAHAAVAGGNIVALLEGKVLKPYKGSAEMIVITLGKEGGRGYLGVLWGIILGNWAVKSIKAKTLLVSSMRATYGLS